MRDRQLPAAARQSARAGVPVVLLALAALAALAAVFVAHGSATAASPTPALDNASVGAFMTREIERSIAPRGIPGVAWVVVDGDGIVADGAWGLADVGRDRPATADTTVWCAGSNGKLLTSTAAMQLVESGALDLDQDVNVYLQGFQLEPDLPEPVTLAHLLTHTSGLDDRIIGTVTDEPGSVRSLGGFLAGSMPDRIDPPGLVTRYSNHGMTLVGHLVASASGRPFEAYVRDRLLRPLRMEHSAFEEPPPADVAADLAPGYVVGPEGSPVEAPRPYVNVVPAGALYVTATDMARFLLVHLRDGDVDGERILEPGTLQRMHARQFGNDPDLAGMAYGFMEYRHGDLRALWHTGTCPMQHHSLLAILPDRGAGLFVAMNAVDRAASHEILADFLDAFFPEDREGAHAGAFEADISPAGTYRRTIQGSWRTVEKITYAGRDLVVRDLGEGLFEMPLEGEPARWRPAGPAATDAAGGTTAATGARQVYVRVGGVERFAVHAVDGRVTGLFTDWAPIAHYRPVAAHETAAFQLPLLVVAGLVFLSPALVWPGAWLVRRRRRRGAASARPAASVAAPSSAGSDAGSRRYRRLWLLTALTALAFVGGFLFVLAPRFANEPGPAFVATMSLPTLFALEACGLAVLAAVGSARGAWGRAGVIGTGAVALAALALTWLLVYWNLVGAAV